VLPQRLKSVASVKSRLNVLKEHFGQLPSQRWRTRTR
jgi:hypothetical protein